MKPETISFGHTLDRLKRWSADQREREAWKARTPDEKLDKVTYGYCADTLESATIKLERLERDNAALLAACVNARDWLGSRNVPQPGAIKESNAVSVVHELNMAIVQAKANS